jgi:hypothetical protein
MNRYFLIRRLRGPVILLLVGVLALLHQTGAIPYFWRFFWPLLLISLGLLLLAERAVLATEGYPPPPGTPWQAISQAPGQSASQAAQQSPGTAIVPAEPNPFGDEIHGGQS